jgi:hypothetical protein
VAVLGYPPGGEQAVKLKNASQKELLAASTWQSPSSSSSGALDASISAIASPVSASGRIDLVVVTAPRRSARGSGAFDGVAEFGRGEGLFQNDGIDLELTRDVFVGGDEDDRDRAVAADGAHGGYASAEFEKYVGSDQVRLVETRRSDGLLFGRGNVERIIAHVAQLLFEKPADESLILDQERVHRRIQGS